MLICSGRWGVAWIFPVSLCLHQHQVSQKPKQPFSSGYRERCREEETMKYLLMMLFTSSFVSNYLQISVGEIVNDRQLRMTKWGFAIQTQEAVLLAEKWTYKELGMAAQLSCWKSWRQNSVTYEGLSDWACCAVTEPCLTACDPVDCSTPGPSVLCYLLEFAQFHVHWVPDAI